MNEYYDEEIDEEEELMYQQMMQGQDHLQMSAQHLIEQGFEIMDEELDENYEPTQEEIVEYAKYLGMDMQGDKDLFYIAKEGLKAPLPGPWKPLKSPREGNIYYYNFESQELQKEHPCDDYYRKYYLQQKQTVRRKKEEKVIKKQIKQQQQQLSSSIGSGQDPKAANSSSLQQMILMNMSGLDVSTSQINEKVQFELEQMMDDFEEKKILHERARRDELKKLESNKSNQKQQIQDDAKKAALIQAEKTKNDFQQNSKIEIEKRKRNELQIEKEKTLREFRDQERKKQEKLDKQLCQKFDRQREDAKQEEERRHKFEQDSYKEQYKNKLSLEKEKILQENERLLEESNDIDRQVRMYRTEMLEDQLQNKKYEFDDEVRQKISQLKMENKYKLEKERERIKDEMIQKLEKEKDKELKKSKNENQKIEEIKNDIKREFQNRLKEEKRKIDKIQGDKLRQIKVDNEEDLENAKSNLKRAVLQQFELKEQNLEKDYQNKRNDGKSQIDRYEDQKKQEFERQKQNLETQFLEEWNTEKKQFLQSENEKSGNYQQIIKDIQQTRQKVRDLDSKSKLIEKDLKKVRIGSEDLTLEKRGKEREIKDSSKIKKPNSYELELESDLREKQDELDRLKSMIRDKQIQRPITIAESNKDYEKLAKEVDDIKVLLLELRTQKALESVPKRSSSQQRTVKSKLIFDYSISEIKTFLEVELPKTKHKREKFENERVLMRQLLSNIERNRTKLRKEYFDATILSMQRKLVLSGIKDKIDEQARILQEEETSLKDKCDYYRRKEEKLRVIKSKVEMYDKAEDEDKQNAILKDVSIDYDKYMKLYQKDLDILQRAGTGSKNRARNQDLIAFQSKWGEYLKEEADKDLKPIIGLYPERELFKPKSLYQKFEIGSSQFKNQVGMYNIYENEISKVRENRDQMRSFLNDQQRWLSKLRNDLSLSITSHPKPSSMQHVGSNESLFNLKNNLSHILTNY